MGHSYLLSPKNMNAGLLLVVTCGIATFTCNKSQNP